LKEIKGGDVQRISEIVFPKGYHIQIIPREGSTDAPMEDFVFAKK
jgi:hypothetical protein